MTPEQVERRREKARLAMAQMRAKLRADPVAYVAYLDQQKRYRTRQQNTERMRRWRRAHPEQSRAAGKRARERIKSDPVRLERLRARRRVAERPVKADPISAALNGWRPPGVED